ncbi:hypothetical protein Sru01_55010 [Sphaerisporangium rufum]|uniref:Uncharacterized protein n=1 Tax=Sphaerisporangium rufum TaxID=1381558 RepID=A0A919V290_9ACTN|nr:hypothetical protein [Sphaerisporangium rufum]GII80519.1 hypothetical protein Sru01_55010 [Sphaerisporangium rufum]
MDRAEGRVLIVILVAMILFGVGRAFQRAVDTWAGWGKAKKAAADAAAKVPPARDAAWAALRHIIVVIAATLLMLALFAKTIRAL